MAEVGINQVVFLGTELKLNVHIDPIDGVRMENYDFFCEFFVRKKNSVKITKDEMLYVDDDNYIALLTSEHAEILRRGDLQVRITAYLPDSDFDDGHRVEIVELWTGITLT